MVCFESVAVSWRSGTRDDLFSGTLKTYLVYAYAYIYIYRMVHGKRKFLLETRITFFFFLILNSPEVVALYCRKATANNRDGADERYSPLDGDYRAIPVRLGRRPNGVANVWRWKWPVPLRHPVRTPAGYRGRGARRQRTFVMTLLCVINVYNAVRAS